MSAPSARGTAPTIASNRVGLSGIATSSGRRSPSGEIGGESNANCRQLAKRARAHINDRRPRFAATLEQRELLITRFLKAVADGDLPALIETLQDDVIHFSDGGGKVLAARKPVIGREKVATFLLNFRRFAPESTRFIVESINGAPGIIVLVDNGIQNVITFDFGESGIRTIYSILNPDKLQPFASALSRSVSSLPSAGMVRAALQNQRSK